MAMEKNSEEQARKLGSAAREIQEHRTGLVLTGRIKDGQLELDQSTLDQIQAKFPTGEIPFVAMNSPFDPQSHPVPAASAANG